MQVVCVASQHSCSKRSALTIYLLIVCAGLHLQPNGTEVMTGIQGQLVSMSTPMDSAGHQTAM